MPAPPSAGDAVPPGCEIIEVHVGELRQLFNAIDPSPFRERDLDPEAEKFIVDWARGLPDNSVLALLVHLDRGAGMTHEAAAFRDSVHEFFTQRAASTRTSLRQLFRRGRISLAIGLACLTLSLAVGDAIARYFSGGRLAEIVGESLLIGGWVAMWRPLEVFLYEWWPIREDAHLFDRLSAMPVRIVYEDADQNAWRHDWPAVPSAAKRAGTTVPDGERLPDSGRAR